VNLGEIRVPSDSLKKMFHLITDNVRYYDDSRVFISFNIPNRNRTLHKDVNDVHLYCKEYGVRTVVR